MAEKSFGIDISSWQGDIDIARLDPDFVIIRGGFGKTVDNKAIRNMDLCEKLGIPYGVYWYSYALSVEAAKEEAAHCLALLQGRQVDVGVWYDMEDADGYKARNGALRRELTSAMCYAFADAVENAGYYSGIYSSLSWLQDGFVSGCERFDKWVACWGTNSGELTTNTERYGTMHQYAGDIRKDGYDLDLDVCYVPLERYKIKTCAPDTGDDSDHAVPGEDDLQVGEPVTSGYLVPVPALSIGCHNGYVKTLQTLMIARGEKCGGKKNIIGIEEPDGIFGPATERAIARLQAKFGQPVTGEVDCDFWDALLKGEG